MKKFIAFLFILVLLVGGALAFLLRNDFEALTESRVEFAATLRERVDQVVYAQAPRPVRLFLLKNLPGLFPVSMVCNQPKADGSKQSLFPGDVAAAAAGASLQCSDGSAIELLPSAELRLLPKRGQPGYQLVQGQIRVTFKKKSAHFDLGHLTFSATDNLETSRLSLATSHDGASIGCLWGEGKAVLDIAPGAEGKKHQVLMRACRLGIKWNASMPEKNLLPGDLVQISDLEKARKDWAPQDYPSALSALGLDPAQMPNMVAKVDAVPASPETVKLNWQSPAPAGIYRCTLYTQENTRTPAAVAHQFQAQAAAGELVLLKGFLKFWISIACDSDTTSVVSNVLAPI